MRKDDMTRYLVLACLLVSLVAFSACGAMRKSGSTVKDASVATGKEVADKSEDVADKSVDVAKKVADKTEDAAEKTVDVTKDVSRKVANKTDDATTTSAIKMKFASDKMVDAFDINVDTKQGHVTLTGTVNSKAEADKAVAIARGIEGVKTVTPRLTIKNK
jgi:hyperosmotically inducible protein